MKKTSVYLFWAAGFLVLASIVLATVAFWMEKKAGPSTPAIEVGASVVPVTSETAPRAGTPDMSDGYVRPDDAHGAGQSQEDKTRDIEYDGVVHGPLTI
jgi:hypothetical protein